MGGGGPSVPAETKQETKTTVEPYSEQIPALQNVMGLSAGLTGAPTENLTTEQQTAAAGAEAFRSSPERFQYFPDQTFANINPAQQQVLNAQFARGMMGSPLERQAQAQQLGTISGANLTQNNPYFQQRVQGAIADVMPQIDARFAGSGRSGSGLASRALGQGVGQAVGNIAYQDYAQERALQEQAARGAPSMAQADYRNLAAAADVGQQLRDFEQQAINEQIERFNFAQQEPYQRLAAYSGAVQGNFGGTTTGTGVRPVQQPGSGSSTLASLGGAGINTAGLLAATGRI